MQIAEARIGRPIEDVLRGWYVDDGHTQQEIAQRLGVDIATVSRWMRLLGIESRYLGPRKVA